MLLQFLFEEMFLHSKIFLKASLRLKLSWKQCGGVCGEGQLGSGYQLAWHDSWALGREQLSLASYSPLWPDLFLHAATKAKGENALHHQTWHQSNGYKWVSGEGEPGGETEGDREGTGWGHFQSLLYHCIKELFSLDNWELLFYYINKYWPIKII